MEDVTLVFRYQNHQEIYETLKGKSKFLIVLFITYCRGFSWELYPFISYHSFNAHIFSNNECHFSIDFSRALHYFPL